MAMRASMPSTRAIAIIAEAKWMQYPERWSNRKLEIASEPEEEVGACRL